MKQKLLISSLLASLLAATSVTAQAGSWGIFADVGQSKFDIEENELNDIDDSDTYYTIGASYSFSKAIEVELGYTDFGESAATFRSSEVVNNNTADASAISLVGIYNFYIGDNFALTGKGGIEYIDAEDLNSNNSDSNTEFLYGLGAKFHFTDSVALRANYDFHDDIDTISLGLKYYF